LENRTSWFRLIFPVSWEDVLIRTVKVALVAFIALQLKEWFDAGVFDTPATVTDAALVAGGTLVLNAILMWMKS
jgi:hypothetical protein